jgi:hypothetical protein
VRKRERDAEAAQWLETYGEPIDCPALSRAASPYRLALARLNQAEAEMLPRIAERAERHARRLARTRGQARLERVRSQQVRGMERLLRTRVPGRSRSLWQLWQDADAAAKTEGKPPPPEPFPLRLYQDPNRSTRRIATAARRQADELGSVPTKRARDWGFGASCRQIAKWVRTRRSDSRAQWPDVVKCLEWHGNDLSHLSHKAEACRQAERRHVRVRLSSARARLGESRKARVHAVRRLEALEEDVTPPLTLLDLPTSARVEPYSCSSRVS